MTRASHDEINKIQLQIMKDWRILNNKDFEKLKKSQIEVKNDNKRA